MIRSKELQKESLNDAAVFVFLRREVAQHTYSPKSLDFSFPWI